jgi:lambda repressor-like predicted transcriptional regulator
MATVDPIVQRIKDLQAKRRTKIAADYAKGLTYRELAAKYVICSSSLAGILKAASVPSRPSGRPLGGKPTLKLAKQGAALRKRGLTYKAISARLGIPEGSVYKVCQQASGTPPAHLRADS